MEPESELPCIYDDLPALDGQADTTVNDDEENYNLTGGTPIVPERMTLKFTSSDDIRSVEHCEKSGKWLIKKDATVQLELDNIPGAWAAKLSTWITHKKAAHKNCKGNGMMIFYRNNKARIPPLFVTERWLSLVSDVPVITS